MFGFLNTEVNKHLLTADSKRMANQFNSSTKVTFDTPVNLAGLLTGPWVTQMLLQHCKVQLSLGDESLMQKP